MVCPKCGSESVHVQSEQLAAKTKNRGNGCLWSMGRWFLIICTCGLWLLVGRHKGSGKTEIKSHTVGICQNCGYKWEINNQ